MKYEKLHHKWNCCCEFISLLSSGTAAFASANESNGGVGLGATRLVYHESDKQISLSLRNTSAQTPFLVQSFVLNSAQAKTEDFVVTPPLFFENSKRKFNQDNVCRS